MHAAVISTILAEPDFKFHWDSSSGHGDNWSAALEAYTCSEGLALAEDLHIANIQLATECLVVWQEINKGSLSSYVSVLKEIAEQRRHSL
jgi:hypothetical protein